MDLSMVIRYVAGAILGAIAFRFILGDRLGNRKAMLTGGAAGLLGAFVIDRV